MIRPVVVLDYGSGNLRSIERALARVGADVEVTGDLRRADAASGLVVPGVGAFAACIAGIDAIGARRLVVDRVRDGRPVLGICVGMQVLFESGHEHGGVTKGLGLVPGSVTRLTAPVVPHIGWNTVDWPPASHLGRGVAPGTRFYFVHSYAAGVDAALGEAGVTAAVACHGERFVAALERDRLWATQFHPEKSGDAGSRLLANWVAQL